MNANAAVRILQLLGLVAIALWSTTSAAQPSSFRFQGNIVDDSGRALEGATVRVLSTGYRSVTDREGRFALNLPTSTDYQVTIQYPGYPLGQYEISAPEDAAIAQLVLYKNQSALEEVFVSATALRNSQAEALARQQSAYRKVDIISADNIGQFPDSNAAEALTRLPGVSADAAEGGRPRTIQIRGMPDRWTTVSYDGLNVIGSQGRVVRFDEIPAAIINSIELNKTLTPDMSAESVSGAVNIITASPFDFEGFFANLSISAGMAGFDQAPESEYSVQLGNQHFDGRFGWMLVGALLEREFNEDRLESENLIVDGVPWPSQIDYTNGRYEQESPGAAVRLELRPSDEHRVFFSSVFTQTKDRGDLQSINILLEDGNGFGDNAGNNSRRGRIDDAPIVQDWQLDNQLSSTWTSTIGGESELWGGKISYRSNYTRTRFKFSREILLTIALGNGPQVNIDYDYTDDEYEPTYLLENSTDGDPGNGQRLQDWPQGFSYGLDVYVPVDEFADTDAFGGRVDFERNADWFDIAGQWQAGLAFDVREQEGLATSVPVAIVGVSESAATGGIVTLPSGAQAALSDTGGLPTSSIDYAGALTSKPWITDIDRHFRTRYMNVEYLLAEARRARAAIIANPASVAALQAVGGGIGLPFQPDNAPGHFYTTQESIFGAYFMHTLFPDWGSIVAGLRAEFYSLDGDGFGISRGETVPNSASQSALDWYPSINLRWDIDDELVFRAALTAATNRPNFAEVRPGVVIDEREQTIFEGNPELEPELVYGLDLSLERYDAGGGLLSIAAFYKDAKKVRAAAQIIGNDGRYNDDTTDRSGYTSVTTVNGGDGWIAGIEATALQYFDDWPGLLSGLGVQANIAFLDSEYEAPARDGGVRKIALPGTSDTIANVSLFWEKFGVTARLNYQYRTEWIETIVLGIAQSLDQYRDASQNFSGSIKYQVTPSFSVQLEGKNLTDERRRTFNEDDDTLLETFAYGTSYVLSMNYSLQ